MVHLLSSRFGIFTLSPAEMPLFCYQSLPDGYKPAHRRGGGHFLMNERRSRMVAIATTPDSE
jgi:hypothetical protein